MTAEVRQESFDTIWERWERILPLCATDSVFLTPWWHRVWWDLFGGSRQPRILSANDGDELIGVAPLMQDGDGLLTFLGDHNLTDYFDFLTPPERADEFYPALWASLLEMEWTTLDLPSIPGASPTLARLPKLAESSGYSVEIEREETTPTARLPANWDAYLAGLRKKDRHELRRKLRRLDRDSSHRQYVVDGEPLDGAMREFFRLLRASRQDKNEFLTPEREEFFIEIARQAAKRNMFELSFLEVDGENAAACICFDYGGDYLLYNSGYDPSYSRLSVGLLNKALSLRAAIENGRSEFNFLKGNERYKYNLGGKDADVMRLQVRR